MKKISIMMGLLSTITSFAQCNIEGKTNLTTSETATFSVANELAQCKDCHQWRILGNAVEPAADYRQNSFDVKAIAEGNSTITLTVLTPKGIEQCSKSISVSNFSSNANGEQDMVPKPQPECDIEVNTFKEVKYDQGIVNLIPNKITADYTYHWDLSLQSGETNTSDEIVPQFNYTLTDPINKIQLKVVSKKCIRKLEKKYTVEFWQYFK